MNFSVVFVVYIPCVATIAALIKEIGHKLAAAAVGYSWLLATVLAGATRLVFAALRLK